MSEVLQAPYAKSRRFVILGDTHFGCRNDLRLFHEHFEKFYDMLLADIEELGITDIFQLGDLFDRRKYINFHTLSESKRYFFDRLQEKGIQLHTLVGNHDIFYRESLELDTASLVLSSYDNVHVYKRPTTIDYAGTKIDIIPWICAENHDEVTEFISKSKSDLCFGHFEIATFSMYRGVESHGGLPVDMFAKYELVCSGHYHTQSKKHNITYVGTPYEMTWQDHGDPRGYHVFDIDTRQMTFAPNPYTIFVRLEYNDTASLPDLDSMSLTSTFVKVVVSNKTDLFKFDQFIQKLYTKGCYDVKIVEDMSEFHAGEIDESINLEDTMDVLSNYIDSIDTDSDKDAIKMFLKTLYVEAVNMEVV